MNKKIKNAISAIMAATVIMTMTACSPKAEESAAPQLISGGTAATAASKEGNADPAATTAAASDTYGLAYKGTTLTPGMDAQVAVNALGAGYIYNEVMSCAFNGMEKTYDYKEIVLFVDSREGKDKINTIEIKDASIDCGGVKIGSTLDDVRKAYGDPTAEELYGFRYDKNKTQIQFIAGEDKKVMSILFKSI